MNFIQNFPTKKQLITNNILKAEKTRLILHKINIKEKPLYKKYLKQFFENPRKFFVSNYANKIIVLNRFKTQENLFELPLPQNLLRRYKARKNKGVQLINDTSIKEQIDDMVSPYNNNKIGNRRRKIILGIKKEKDDKRDKREITEEELQKIYAAFEDVRSLNKNRIDNFITKNEYVDLMYKNYKENNENNDDNTTEDNKEIKENNDDIKFRKYVKSKSSLAIRNRSKVHKDDLHKKIVSAKIVKFNDRNSINIYKRKNSEIIIPKIPEKMIHKSKTFASIFDEKLPQKIPQNKNEENNLTTNSQYSTLYKTRNKSFLSNLKKTYNKYLEAKTGLNREQLLLEKQYQYTMDVNSTAIKKEFAKKLATQEKALNHNKKIDNRNNNMMEILAKKINKEKDDLIIAQVDDYRIMKDIKSELQDLIEKNIPEYNYKWNKDLRNNSEDCHYKKINNQIQREIVRNPLNAKNRANSVDKRFGEAEKNYIRQNIRKSDYRKFVRDLSMSKGNFNGLLIKGKNLLKCEKDLIKKIKGKKYIINYNSTLQEKDINDVLYTYNININNYSIPK